MQSETPMLSEVGMRRSRFIVFVCLVALVMGAHAANAQELGRYPSTLSLAQAVEIALRENPSLSASQSQVEIAEQRIVQIRAGFLPRLNVSDGFQRTNNPRLCRRSDRSPVGRRGAG